MSAIPNVTLELRERSMDSTNATEKTVLLGTHQPVVLIEFVGVVGQELERIIIDATGWEAAALAILFEDLAKGLRSEPEAVYEN
jgi:hypothetical protein